MFGKLNNQEIEKLIHGQFIGRIGCHANGQTYVVPVSYAYDGTYIYGRTFEGMKIDMMRTNPQVCFEVDDTKNLANWQSVIAWGKYEELSDETQRKKAIKILMNRHLPLISSETTHLGGIWPFSPEDLNTIKGIIFRIFLKEKTGRFERSKTVPLVYAT